MRGIASSRTEKAVLTEFMSMAGDLSALLNGIGLAVCFTILFVTTNTMSMAVRERRTEIAVLKTLGFRSAHVMASWWPRRCSWDSRGGSSVSEAHLWHTLWS